MKKETLNKKLLEGLKEYGFKQSYNGKWTYKMFDKFDFVVLIEYCNVDIRLEQSGSTYLIVASRYECGSVKDLDFLLKNCSSSPFYFKHPEGYVNKLKELNK